MIKRFCDICGEEMTDRELLELAAKAAGIEYTVKDDEYYKTHKFFGLWLVLHGEPYEGQRRYWNPLADEGDAFRLAGCLHFEIDFGKTTAVRHCSGIKVLDKDAKQAIVRAAAELGKGMK